jgi:hypothetical protein
MLTRSSLRSSSIIVLTLVTVLSSLISPAMAQTTGAEAKIDLEKFISVDGQATWQDADNSPGPDVALGSDVYFRFRLTNTGDVPLTNLSLTDNAFDVSSCALPAALTPEAFYECTIGPVPASEGQHTDTALATGEANGTTVSDTDSASYFGGDRPALDLEKLISVDGGATWQDANSPPGPRVKTDGDVLFRFVITNNGNVPLSSISLIDSTLDTSSCALPAALDPGASYECTVGPVEAGDGQHTNTATAGGVFNGETYTDIDKANYFGGEGELPVTIVIEGPVEQINVNVIVIFGFNVEIASDDPLLAVIKVGDVVHVEGSLDHPLALGGNIVIVAVNIVVVNVNIYVNADGQQVWRDEGNCKNPPPPWAPAHGWRRRCENHQGDEDD